MKPTPLSEIASLLEIDFSKDLLVHGVAIDSRLVKEGDLFVALAGARVDGHAFLEEVAHKKAGAALVSDTYQGADYGLSLLRVPDTLLALQQWARKRVETLSAKIIAITGSMGKTTTKEFTKTLLEPHYKVHASPLSYNSKLTLPLTILQAQGDEDFLILEMGMSEPGEIATLVSIAPPDIALITTLALQHANHFSEGIEGIAREKGMLFSHPKTALTLFPETFPQLAAFAQCKRQSFSMTSPDADFYLKRKGDNLYVKKKGEEREWSLPLATVAFDYNFLAAVALASSVGISLHSIEKRSAALKAPPLRFERVERKGIVFINDAYNANPTAMKVAFAHLPRPQKEGRKIAVLSEMNALGKFAYEEHLAVAESALEHVDHLLCVGKECEVMAAVWRDKPFELFATREALFRRVQEMAQQDDVILLKGARSYRLEELLQLF